MYVYNVIQFIHDSPPFHQTGPSFSLNAHTYIHIWAACVTHSQAVTSNANLYLLSPKGFVPKVEPYLTARFLNARYLWVQVYVGIDSGAICLIVKLKKPTLGNGQQFFFSQNILVFFCMRTKLGTCGMYLHVRFARAPNLSDQIASIFSLCSLFVK